MIKLVLPVFLLVASVYVRGVKKSSCFERFCVNAIYQCSAHVDDMYKE